MTDAPDTPKMSGTDPDQPDGSDRSTESGETAVLERDESAEGATGDPSSAPRGGDGVEIAFDPSSEEILHTTAPLIRPVLGLMGTVAVVAAIVIGVLMADPSLVGGATLAEIVVNAVLLLATIILIRLAVRALVLWRTTYTIRADGFETAYELAYRSNARKIPVTQLRGQEFDQGRYQTLFDCATISLLTGGTNRSLGFVEFEHVPDPETVQRTVRRVRRAHEEAEADS